MTITAPPDDVFVSGITRLSVDVSAAVRSVRFFVDGRLVCTVEQSPFACTSDLGAIVRGHHVRVIATLADGSRIVGNVRTKDLGYTERARVDAVLVPVVVTDHGRSVRGLRREDFEVLEDGVRQRIVAFADEESPLDLVVAVDVSGSMEAALGRVKEAVKQFLGRLRPADAVTLVGFNDTTFVLAEREQDQRTREDAVDQLAAWGGTALYDATMRAVDLVDRSPGRKGVVVFSDGDDRHSLAGPDLAAARVQTGNAMLYAVGFGGAATVPSLRQRLERYAQSTGGRAFFAGATNELGPAFDAILLELSNQYVLSYMSTNTRMDGGWRSIRVRVTNGKHSVRTRAGYQAALVTDQEGKP
jgi:Ca-activated chloride channel family protein